MKVYLLYNLDEIGQISAEDLKAARDRFDHWSWDEGYSVSWQEYGTDGKTIYKVGVAGSPGEDKLPARRLPASMPGIYGEGVDLTKCEEDTRFLLVPKK